ncbi:16419_t:CDS:2, partial [Entrophospora sp. SA101]
HMPIFFLITLYLLLFSPFNSATQTPLKENTNLMENSLDESIENYCAPSGLISDACCDYKTVENINNDLFPRLQELIKTDFFKYYKLNLYKECPFWHENGQCINQACAVETTDESNVPEMWRSNVLGALQTSSNGLKFCTISVLQPCISAARLLEQIAESFALKFLPESDLQLHYNYFTAFGGGGLPTK